MTDSPFPSNSNKKKKEEEKADKVVEKVVTGDVIKKKRSVGRRFKDIFFSGDFTGVTRYVASDVLLPALKNMVVDTTRTGVERMVYGESISRRRSNDGRSRIRYDNPMRDPRTRTMLPDQPPHPPPGRRGRYDTGEIIVSTRSEAETVVERLTEIIEKYDVASVADLYELLGLPTNYVDNKWGWSVLQYVDIRQNRDGWLIDLPTVEPI